jgi:DNA adenine methylase
MESRQRHSESILRWAGSKRQLLPHLRNSVPNSFKRYVEPFAGSASLFFELEPRCALLSDMNAQLVLTYRMLRRNPQSLHTMISSWPTEDQFYYDLRSVPADCLNNLERAGQFVYLNRYSFNGVYRTNRIGHFNVPRGTRTGQLPSLQHFRDNARALRRAELRAEDFELVLEEVGRGDFVYLDPPYRKLTVRNRGEYGKGSFERCDLERFVDSVLGASRRGAKILISYFNSKSLIHELAGWTVSRVRVRRHVAGFSESREKVYELLIRNY